MKALLLLTLSTLINTHAQSKSILVSDVDDTIKVSYILDKDSVAANMAMVKNAFIGMPELYQAMAKSSSVDAIKYLSNAPRKIVADLHLKFLEVNQFPEGELLTRRLRDLNSGNSHKLDSIRKFIAIYNPTQLILIGDNGESDAEIYELITLEFPKISALTYIRQAYSSHGFKDNFAQALRKGQIPFVSSIDIAIDLHENGALSQAALTQHVLNIVPRILKEGYYEERGRQMAFPEWYDCRDYPKQNMPILIDVNANKLLQRYSTKVEFRCNREPFGG